MRRALHALLRHLQRLKLAFPQRFTGAGLLLLSGCVAAAVLGLDTRLNLSYQLFVLFGTVLVVGWLGSLSFPLALDVKRRLPERATVDEPLRYRVLIHNRGRRALREFSLRESPVLDFAGHARAVTRGEAGGIRERAWRRIYRPFSGRRIGGGFGPGFEAIPTALETLPAGATHELILTLIPKRRGLLKLDSLLVLRPDPLGLVNAIKRVESHERLLVLPRTYPIPALDFSGSRCYQRGGVNLALSVGNEDEFVGLREYRPGESLRHIHWQSLARLGKLVVKEYQDEYYVRHGLVLDTDRPPGSSPAFEAAVSAAASFASTKRQPDVLLDLLLIGNRAYQVTAGRGVGLTENLLTALAAVEPKPGSWSQLAAVVEAHATTLSACICVLLDWDTSRQRLVRSLRQRGLQVLVVVIGRQALRAEAGVHVIAPDQLAHGLAKLSLHHDISPVATATT